MTPRGSLLYSRGTWTALLALVYVVNVVQSAPLPYVGVNLSGADFGTTMPGTFNQDYTYPSTNDIDYFVTTKKMTAIRLPFRWERLQRAFNSTFDVDEQSRLSAAVSAITSRGAVAIIEPHNYARYKISGIEYLIGSQQVSYGNFYDFWFRLSTLFKDNNLVWFNLMNEPNSMDTAQWRQGAQHGIDAIRANGATNKILVPGNRWTGAHSWTASDVNNAANSVEMLLISDPGNNYAFEVHQYLDGDSSGQSSTCVSNTIGAERLTAFTDWLRTNNKKGFLGEIGGANNPTCQNAVAGALDHMESNSDVWLGWTWWAAGPWWPPEYIFLLQPTNNYATDAPQMAWLTSSIPGALPPQTASAPTVATAPVRSPQTQAAAPTAAPTFVAAGSSVDFFGVNLAAAEFGEGNLPGTFNQDYTWPSDAEINYFVTTKKMKLIRLPFRWERLQTSLNTTFNSAESARLQAAVQSITSRGAVALLDPHNYARYRVNGNDQLIGSSQVPYGAFYDFWTRLAALYKQNSLVWFGLINEPYGMPTEQWLEAAQVGINAIRAAGANNKILVPGNAYTGAHSWESSWYGTPNGQVMNNITDPANNYAFEVHQYLDDNSSGQSATCTSTTIGSQRLQAFTAWLKRNNRKGFLGEFGGGNNPTCEAAVYDMLNYIQANKDVWIGWSWWAAGPWWPSNYIFLLEPTNNFQIDAPMMSWLTPFMIGPAPTSTPKAPVGSATPSAKVNSNSAVPTVIPSVILVTFAVFSVLYLLC